MPAGMADGHCAEVLAGLVSAEVAGDGQGFGVDQGLALQWVGLAARALVADRQQVVENRAPVKAPEVMVPPTVITPFLLVSRSVTAALEGLKPEPAGQLTVTVPVSVTDL